MIPFRDCHEIFCAVNCMVGLTDRRLHNAQEHSVQLKRFIERLILIKVT